MSDILYVVRGAQVKCDQGSCPSRLNLPKGHGVYVNDKPVMIDTDCQAGVNVMPFGNCSTLSGPCAPALSANWDIVKEDTRVQGRPPLTTKSVLCCMIGGLISVDKDGQWS
jgi:hypothetical protein